MTNSNSNTQSSRTRELVLAAILGVLTFLGTYISVPMYPVPITLQTLFVLLSGLYLSPYFAALSMAVCLILRLLIGGFAVVVSPSFGFLIAFIVAAVVISKVRGDKKLSYVKAVGLLVIGEIILYLIGLPYMTAILNVYLAKNLSAFTLLKVGMLLFIPGDIVKLLLAAYVYKCLPQLKFLQK